MGLLFQTMFEIKPIRPAVTSRIGPLAQSSSSLLLREVRQITGASVVILCFKTLWDYYVQHFISPWSVGQKKMFWSLRKHLGPSLHTEVMYTPGPSMNACCPLSELVRIISGITAVTTLCCQRVTWQPYVQ